MKRIVFSIGALPFACLASEIYKYCLTEPLCKQENGFLFNYNWFLWIAFGLVAFGLLLDFLHPSIFMMNVPTGLPRFSTSREEAELDLDQLYKDMTGRYTQAELCQMKWDELRNQSQHIGAARWWAGDSDEMYTDGDGFVRYVETGKIVGGE